jgi:hypothetical protein
MLLAPPLAGSAAPVRVGGSSAASLATLNALHRSGQTFLTWPERADLAGEHYRLYRHTQPITAGNLSQATRLYEVPEGTARFYANRYLDGETWRYRYLERYVIEDGGAALAAGTGLLVWTLAAQDFGGASSGAGYYAVTVVPAGGAEALLGATGAPLAESVAAPRPVEAAANLGQGGHLYIQYMDLRAWNPTFHAPNELNAYYGLDPSDPAIAGAIQYAYDYVVYEPRAELCGGSLPARAPAFINLHGWAGNTYGPVTEHPDPWWCSYAIYPVDQGETWYFGFARHHDYRAGGEPAAGDEIMNYTEQRILRMVYDLMQAPPGPAVDAERLYIYGHSMGASGVLAFALRYPNVFAAAYCSEPMTNYATSGDGGGTDWRTDVSPKWGARALNLLVEISAPGGWAAHLARYNGRGVWDWQNHQANLQSRQGDEMVPFGIGHGRADTVIEWATQGRPAYVALNASRRAWGGMITDDEHNWLSFAGLPPSLGASSSAGPFADLRAVRSESVPGLSNTSTNLPLPPPDSGPPGGYNLGIRWSSSWDPWDGAPVDTVARYQISLCAVRADPDDNACGTGAALTVDVTPRRLQQFRVTASARYTWENRRVSDSALVASGSVAADTYGLVTVAGFAVSPGGNRLILRPAAGATPSLTRTAGSTPSPLPSPTRPPQPALAAIPLVKGWNLVSLPGTRPATAPAEVLSSIAGRYTLVYGYVAGDPANPWRLFSPDGPSWANSLNALSNSQGLWIKANQLVTLTLQGTALSAASIPLKRGWNLVGYPIQQSLPISVALQSIAGRYDQVYAFDGSDPTNPWEPYFPGRPPAPGDLTQMRPGRGYWVHATSDATLVLPPPPAATATHTRTRTPARSPTATRTRTPAATPTRTATVPPSARRPWPDSGRGVHVFNDQLSHDMSDALWRFSATHYAGTQKMSRSAADRLRALNPNFLILHYRLGHALGYRAIENNCQPTGEWLLIIEGNDWVQEWPGDAAVRENWFYHWPQASATRVLNCDWGWYLAEVNDSGWRAWWQGEVLRQVRANDDDGLFMDSLSVPNYLGADHYRPVLPDLDNAFESAWDTRIKAWLEWLQTQPLGDYYLIPNAGSWITTRDPTDYSPADGVMLEGFAIEADQSPYALEDWVLQMNRVLGMISRGKVIIGQTYATGAQERMFALGTYLLVKGSRTYLNIDLGLEPEWWPEYDIPIGQATQNAGTDIATLYDAANQVYWRNYDNGFVLVNPTNPWDGSGVTRTVRLGGTYYLAETSGGGEVPESGVPRGTVSYRAVTQVTLGPFSAAVLFNARP